MFEALFPAPALEDAINNGVSSLESSPAHHYASPTGSRVMRAICQDDAMDAASE